MGSKPSKQQIDKLISFFTRLVIVPDSDKSGHEMYKILRSKFDKKIPFVFKQLPNGSDPGDLKKEDIIKILGRPEIIENVDITDFD
jgi:DNA primase